MTVGGWEVAVGGGGVRGLFFSGCLGVIREGSLSGRGVRRCSGLFRFVRICSGLFGVRGGVDGVKFWQPLSTFVNLVSTSVKCQDLVTAVKVGFLPVQE